MIPLGAWGRDVENDRLALDVAVFDADGHARVMVTWTELARDDPEGLGRRVAEGSASRVPNGSCVERGSATGSPDATGTGGSLEA